MSKEIVVYTDAKFAIWKGEKPIPPTPPPERLQTAYGRDLTQRERAIYYREQNGESVGMFEKFCAMWGY